jgi:hypothetical protein
MIGFLYRHRPPPYLTDTELVEWYEEFRLVHSDVVDTGPDSPFDGAGNPYFADHQFNEDPHLAPRGLPPIDAVRELYAAVWATDYSDDPPNDTAHRSLLHRSLHKCGWTHGNLS